MGKTKIDIEDIQGYIDDAFAVWPEMDCTLNDLLGYVEEYNPCFLEKEDNPERAVHVILFAATAITEGCELCDAIKEECRKEISYLAREEPQILQKERKLLENYL